MLNGIIENHGELKKALIADGERFTSETDAEVVAHLIRREYRGCLVEAVQRAYTYLEGHFAFIAVHEEHRELLVGARRQCPLLVGLGDGETFLASSITAFSGETRRIKLLEDDEIVRDRPDGVRVTTPHGEERDAGSDRGVLGRPRAPRRTATRPSCSRRSTSSRRRGQHDRAQPEVDGALDLGSIEARARARAAAA